MCVVHSLAAVVGTVRLTVASMTYSVSVFGIRSRAALHTCFELTLPLSLITRIPATNATRISANDTRLFDFLDTHQRELVPHPYPRHNSSRWVAPKKNRLYQLEACQARS